MYPVSFLKALTEFRKKRFGMSEPGYDPFSLQSGHSLSSDSSSAVRTPVSKIIQRLNFWSDKKISIRKMSTTSHTHAKMYKFYLHSSQNELPQHGIMTASAYKSLHILQSKSSGISCFFSGIGAVVGCTIVSFCPSIKDLGIPVLRLTSLPASPIKFKGQFLIQ